MPSTNGPAAPGDRWEPLSRFGVPGIVIGASATGALVSALVVLAASNLTSDRSATASGATQAVRQEPIRPEPVKREQAKAEPAPAAAADTSTVDCEQQTWPHISQACIEAKKRSVRVVSTDKPPASTAAAAQPAPTPPAVAAPATNAVPPATRQTTGSGSASAGVLEPFAAAGTDAARAPQPPSHTAAISDEPRKRADRKSKRKQKAKSRSREREIDSDVQDTGGRTEWAEGDRERTGRRDSGRWTEREYDVPSDDGRGRRRVIIIDGNRERSDNFWRF